MAKKIVNFEFLSENGQNWLFLSFISSILVQNLDFWHENSIIWWFLKMKYLRISSNFGAKIQIPWQKV